MLLFVGYLTSQQHASVSQGRICSDNCTCCHTEIEVADQPFYLTQSHYIMDTRPTSPGADPISLSAWQCDHWSAFLFVCLLVGLFFFFCLFVFFFFVVFLIGYWYNSIRKKSPSTKRKSNPVSAALTADALTTRPTRQ